MGNTDSFYTTDAAKAAAKAAHLRYVHDGMPGITRKAKGKNFAYLAPTGEHIGDEAVLERIRKLAIPPAYAQVWICTLDNGHIQATGRDAKQRKQYRYHAKWHAVRNENKFHHIADFATVLPDIRARVDADMAQRNLSRTRVLATVVSLMDKSNIRIGNAQYARDNDSFGLTTLQRDHADVTGNKLHLEFKGKSGKLWNVDIRDKRIAQTIKKMEEIPGQELFHYLDDAGTKHKISSDDVNAYLHDITGQAFTAKDFRTLAATTRAIALLAAWPYDDTKKAIAAHLKASIITIADELGHTPTICRKSYIYPKVIEEFTSGNLHRWHQDLSPQQQADLTAHFLQDFSA